MKKLLLFLILHSSFSAPPNVVVILADDLGCGDLGCYNKASKIKTPNLDRLHDPIRRVGNDLNPFARFINRLVVIERSVINLLPHDRAQKRSFANRHLHVGEVAATWLVTVIANQIGQVLNAN